MSQLATHFAGKGYVEVHLVLYGIKREVFYPIPKTIVIHTPPFEFLNSRRIWHTVKTLFFLRKTIKLLQPDTILSFGEVWNNLVLLALIGVKFPVFVSDRAQPDFSWGRLHNMLRNRLYPTATAFIAQTEKAKEIAELEQRNKLIKVIGNPIRDILPGRPEEKENIVLTVGRLIQTKHLDELIRLFVRINRPGWKLVIVGGDAQKQNLMIKLQGLIRELGAKERVELAGTKADVDNYYRKSRIFAFTSSSEGFPNVVGEAMSAGLPVVSFDCVAGPSEMIEDGINGFLVDMFNYDAFAKRLKQLMEDTELRAGLGARARESMQQFSVEAVGEQFYSFILGTDI